jgi:hypothetical protein
MASVAGPRPPCGVHPSGSVVRGPAVQPSGVQPVQCPVTWVRRPGMRRSGRLVSTRPTSQSSGVRPRPSGRVRLLLPQAVALGTRSMWRLTLHHRNGSRSLWAAASSSGSVDGRGGLDAGDAAEGARRSVRGRWRTRAGLGEGGGRGCPLTDQAGQADARSARGWRLREGTGAGGSARLPHLPRGCRPRAGWATTVGGGRGACRPGGRAGGASGRTGGDGCAAPARPKHAGSAPGSAPAAL